MFEEAKTTKKLVLPIQNHLRLMSFSLPHLHYIYIYIYIHEALYRSAFLSEISLLIRREDEDGQVTTGSLVVGSTFLRFFFL